MHLPAVVVALGACASLPLAKAVTTDQLQASINALNTTIMAQAQLIAQYQAQAVALSASLSDIQSQFSVVSNQLYLTVKPECYSAANSLTKLMSQLTNVIALNPFLKISTAALNGLPGPHVLLESVNLHVRSGGGSTYGTAGTAYAGLGNIIAGYNGNAIGASRTGSNSLIVGDNHQFDACGVLVAGYSNTIAATGNAAVCFGTSNSVSGNSASALGGQYNSASGSRAVVAGGQSNRAESLGAFVGGGLHNIASASYAAVLAGNSNQASGYASVVLGGLDETATASSGVNNF